MKIQKDLDSSFDETFGGEIKRSIDWILDKRIFANVSVHGNAVWYFYGVIGLVRIAVFWMWSEKPTLVDAADSSISYCRKLFGDVAINSYQTLTNALQKYDSQIRPVLWRHLQGLMQKTNEAEFRIGLWLVLAVDGSRFNVPRTLSNQQAFCKPPRKKKPKKKGRNNAKKKKKRGRTKQQKQPTHKKKHYAPQPVRPQMWLTLVWHVGQRLPWCWKIGPSYSSERDHMKEMLHQEFPENTLFCGDAGFVGYNFWNAIDSRGHSLLIRAGGNVRLMTKLGWYAREKEGIVYSWPNQEAKRKRPPLVLRLIKLQDSRNRVIYLLTNVLNQKKLSRSLAGKLYRQRWGIEVQFRTVKQTYNRSKLRSRTPEKAIIELHWSLLSLWMVQLLAYREQVDIREPDEKTSMAQVLRILREFIGQGDRNRGQTERLADQFADATTDTYQRPNSKKKSHNYPRRKEEPFAGQPIVKNSTKEQKQNLKKIQLSHAA
jgi:hypothetical protein